MATKAGGAYIEIRGEDKRLQNDLDKARGKVKTTANKMEKHFKETFKNIGKAAIIGATAVAAAYIYSMKKAIDAASDLQEVQGKFDVVFAEHKKQAEDMAKVLVDSYAMSTREAKQYMSSIQDLLVPMGMMSDKALLMSNEVIKLAADLGSFNNLPTAQVMLDIQSALVGNFETMKKYGVILNETVIKQKALELGLWSGKGMVDANTKAQIAYKLMLEGSAAAIGDQERTMGSYANQMKLLKAQIEDIRAAIGNELLPQVTGWTNQLNIAIKQNPQIIKQIGEFTKNILNLAIAMGKVVGFSAEFTNVWVTTWQAMGLASTGVITWAEALTDATGAVERFNRLQAGPKFYKVSWPETEKPEVLTSVAPKQLARTEEYYKQLEALAQEKRDSILEIENEEIRIFEENLAYRLELKQQYYRDLETAAQEAREFDEEMENEKMRMAAETAAYQKQITEDEVQARLGFYQSMASGIANVFTQIAQAGGKSSEEAFRMYQAFAIAEAIIAANLAAAKVVGQLGIFGIPLSAMVWGMAMANVAMIAAAKPPSYDQGGISEKEGLYRTGPIREAHIPIPSGGKIPVKVDSKEKQTVQIIMNNPTFQDLETQRQTMAQIASVVAAQVAPGAVIENYENDLGIRQMVRGGI